MRQLIVDYLPFEISAQQINESIKTNDGRVIVKGVLQRAEKENQNGRIYPKDLLMREAKKYTENFINQKKLKLMKDNVILVNTSRGEIINEGDLISHIKRKRKFQYIADVISNENKKENNRRNLLSLKNNVILTPHIGGLTEESIKITDNFIYKKFLKYYLGN